MNAALSNEGRLPLGFEISSDAMIPTQKLPAGFTEPVALRDGTVIAERRAMRAAPVARGKVFKAAPPRRRLSFGRWRCGRR